MEILHYSFPIISKKVFSLNQKSLSEIHCQSTGVTSIVRVNYVDH